MLKCVRTCIRTYVACGSRDVRTLVHSVKLLRLNQFQLTIVHILVKAIIDIYMNGIVLCEEALHVY